MPKFWQGFKAVPSKFRASLGLLLLLAGCEPPANAIAPGRMPANLIRRLLPVTRGLDPRVHLLRSEDGLPGQARQ